MQETIFHFIVNYGYIGLFISLILGIVGIPLPDEWLLTFAGYLVSAHKFNFIVTLIVSFLGSICGMTVSFLIGHRYGIPLLENHGSKIGLSPEKLAKAQYWFDRFGKFAVTLGYFIPGVRHLTALSAGISKWSYREFVLYAAPGGFAWVLTFVTLGAFLEEHWQSFAEALHRYMWMGMAVVAAMLLAGWGIKSYWFRKGNDNETP